MGALPVPELSRVVLIGTGDFKSEQLPDLPAVHRNLLDLQAAIAHPVTGVIGWEQCAVIDSPDSSHSFMTRLKKHAYQAQDLLLVYYAGHGIRHERHDKLYLSTRETDLDELDTTAVAFDSVREVIELSSAKTRLLILDCCYSGMVLGAMSAGQVDPREIAVTGTTVIASCPRNSLSHSPPNERNTAFTGALLSLLTDGAPLPGRPLDVTELISALRAAMAKRGMPLPQTQSGNTSGKLLLRREPPARHHGPPVPVPQTAVHQALSDVLVTAGFADSGPSRRLLIRELRAALGLPLDVSSELPGRHQLIELVNACGRAERGLSALVGVFGFLRPESPECFELQRLVALPERPALPELAMRTDLVDALVRTGLTQDRSTWWLLIAELRTSLGQPLDLSPEFLTTRDQVIELVNACVRIDDGLITLAHVLEFLRPGTREVAEFRSLVEIHGS